MRDAEIEVEVVVSEFDLSPSLAPAAPGDRESAEEAAESL